MPVESLIAQFGIPAVALLICLGELGLPVGVPAELTVFLAGSFAIHSPFGLLAGIAILTIGDMIGTTGMHLAARTGGVRLLNRFTHGSLRWNSPLESLHRRLGGHESAVVFVSRSLPLVRMWAAIGTGLMRIRVRSFLVGAFPAAVLWTGLPLTLGYLFRDNVREFQASFAVASGLILLLFPIVTVSTALTVWVRKGATNAARVQRTRAAVGLGASLASCGFLIKVMVLDRWGLPDLGLSRIEPALATRALLLFATAVSLAVVALLDMRSSGRPVIAGVPGIEWRRPRIVIWESAMTTTLLSLLGLAIAVAVTMATGSLDLA